ncbi:hypothetical protein [Saccharothrix deserti]|uniref:hypothetical protein n=1 Tax=Saccharothrix deserti TaxID=2593674 RepID=UPI00131E8013|nr:hypothetical protein [Saccharothrix deserti]
MDPISLAVGGVIFAAGYVIGFLTKRSRPSAPQLTAICGCGHGLDQHDPETWTCHAEVRRDEFDGVVVRHVYVPCTCRQYTGPKPIEELFAPKYLPPND